VFISIKYDVYIQSKRTYVVTHKTHWEAFLVRFMCDYLRKLCFTVYKHHIWNTAVCMSKRSPYNRPPRAYRGSRDIAVPILDLGARRGWGGQYHAPATFTPGKDPVHTVQQAGWAPGPVWTCAKILTPTGIRSPDRPARSQLLWVVYPNLLIFTS
jgi:hypothetical protein